MEDPLCDDDLNEVENVDFVMFDDNQDVSEETEEDEGPDVSILDLCLTADQDAGKPARSCTVFYGGEGPN